MALAGWIILLHCLIPHVHEGQGRLMPDSPTQDLTWIGWIKDLVHTDLGEGHLEDIVKDKDAAITLHCFNPQKAFTDFLALAEVPFPLNRQLHGLGGALVVVQTSYKTNPKGILFRGPPIFYLQG